MGTVNVDIEVGDPTGYRFETLIALVDTGASLTTLPGSTLRNLGVTPRNNFSFFGPTEGKFSGTWAELGSASTVGRKSRWWCSVMRTWSLC